MRAAVVFQFFMFVQILNPSFANAATSGPAKLTIRRDLSLLELPQSGFSTEVRDIGGDEKCSMQIRSQQPTLIAGQTFEGIVTEVDRETHKDSDSLGKIGMTQINFAAEDGSLIVYLSCFKSALFFPTLGLPSLEGLRAMAAEYVVYKKQ